MVNPFEMGAKKRYEKRVLRDLKKQYDKLSTRSKAIFDMYWEEPKGVRTRSKPYEGVLRVSGLAGDIALATTLRRNPEKKRITRADDIKAYNKAFEALSNQIKKGQIVFEQQKKMGRRPAKSSSSKLKIQAQAPAKTASTATGRYTPIGGRNTLKIKGGVN